VVLAEQIVKAKKRAAKHGLREESINCLPLFADGMLAADITSRATRTRGAARLADADPPGRAIPSLPVALAAAYLKRTPASAAEALREGAAGILPRRQQRPHQLLGPAEQSSPFPYYRC